MKKLPLEYYQQNDVLFLSKDLLGKFLFTKIDDTIVGGIITETEAYKAPEDKASHAWNNKKTAKNSAMFSSGGIAYVYLCYGIHPLFNVVTGLQNIPHAILVRSILPTKGIKTLLQRRKKTWSLDITNGPGKLTQGLGITKEHNYLCLTQNIIWIEDSDLILPKNQIEQGPRIGIDYAGEWAKKPWRFFVKKTFLKENKKGFCPSYCNQKINFL